MRTEIGVSIPRRLDIAQVVPVADDESSVLLILDSRETRVTLEMGWDDIARIELACFKARRAEEDRQRREAEAAEGAA